jgi:hypothetical protein
LALPVTELLGRALSMMFSAQAPDVVVSVRATVGQWTDVIWDNR